MSDTLNKLENGLDKLIAFYKEAEFEIVKLRADNAKLRAFLADSAEEECEYGDGCPMFVSRHGTCWTCEVKRFLAEPKP